MKMTPPANIQSLVLQILPDFFGSTVSNASLFFGEATAPCQFAGNAHWAEPSPLFALRVRATPLKCKNEYLMLALWEKTAV